MLKCCGQSPEHVDNSFQKILCILQDIDVKVWLDSVTRNKVKQR